MKKKVEILAPAGSFESLKAAVAAGADAVYIGGSRFGARAYAENPDEDRLLEAIDYVHIHGRRLYLTVNTLVKEEELDEMFQYLLPYYERGLDAVIVQDMGVFSFIREVFPELPIHASTQMTITGSLGAKLITDMGASRIVTARELSLEEISLIYKETGAEIESFVHGALCYAYSGQCLFSSLIGGRSGNRGRCAQTCRLPFEAKRDGKALNKKDEKYLLSLKDLCTLDILPDLIEAGVYSMKIEGRMKSPRYTAGVVSVYRKYADLYLEKGREGYRVKPEDRTLLAELFNRGGQTEGYYKKHNGRDMAVLKEKPAFREENRALYDYLDQTYVEAVLKEAVTGHVTAAEGEPLLLTLDCGSKKSSVSGALLQTAKNQPMTEEKIRKQIEKTGNTPFDFKELTIHLSGNCFIPVQELNELRRSAFEQLEGKILADYRRSFKENGKLPSARTVLTRKSPRDGLRFKLHVALEQPEGLKAVLDEDYVDSIYIDSAGFDAADWKKTVNRCRERGKECLLILPHIFRSEAAKYFEQNRERFLNAGFDGVVLKNLEEIQLLKEWGTGLFAVLDYSVYVMNSQAELALCNLLPEREKRFTLPVELNAKELGYLGCEGRELIVYGHIPVMVTAQCMKKTTEGCTGKPELLYLKDRMGKEFPVKNHCRFCYNTIYNCTPLSLLSEGEVVKRLNPDVLRLNFTTESETRIRTVIEAFADGLLFEKTAKLSGEFTKGHFRRGVE